MCIRDRYPSDQKCLFPYLYFKFACRSNIINADLPFKYPINDDTLNFGGIITNMCTSVSYTHLITFHKNYIFYYKLLETPFLASLLLHLRLHNLQQC